MNHDRETAIRTRAHELWVESGHAHGRHEQHWRQAEREHDAAASPAPEAPAPTPARPARTKAAAPATGAPPARKPRAPRRTPASPPPS